METIPSVPERAFTTADLRRELTPRQIGDAVRAGTLIRARRDRYLPAGTHPDLVAAVAARGRLDCLSLLALLGVFVRETHALHVQVTAGTSRVRPVGDGVVRHWRSTVAAETEVAADLIEALAQSCLCQEPRAAVATLDSAWHRGLVDEEGIGQVFARLPERFLAVRRLLDRRSESGTESLLRLMLRQIGCRVDVQVEIPGVGRVDLVVDGWLIVECDSRAHHAGWDAQRRDRRRDMAAASLGYTTIRPIAEDILFQSDPLRQQLRQIVMSRRAVSNSSSRARIRRRKADSA